jgi:hypothetical protein
LAFGSNLVLIYVWELADLWLELISHGLERLVVGMGTLSGDFLGFKVKQHLWMEELSRFICVYTYYIYY